MLSIIGWTIGLWAGSGALAWVLIAAYSTGFRPRLTGGDELGLLAFSTLMGPISFGIITWSYNFFSVFHKAGFSLSKLPAAWDEEEHFKNASEEWDRRHLSNRHQCQMCDEDSLDGRVVIHRPR